MDYTLLPYAVRITACFSGTAPIEDRLAETDKENEQIDSDGTPAQYPERKLDISDENEYVGN